MSISSVTSQAFPRITVHEIATCEQCDRSAEGWREPVKDNQGRTSHPFICYDCFDENEVLYEENERRRREEENEKYEDMLAMLGQTQAQFEAGLAAR